MKKSLLLIAGLFMFFMWNVKGQITLDTIIVPTVSRGSDFYTVQISRDETKYYFADTLTNTFSLYNMDFTPFLTNISVPEPFAITSSSAMQVLYLTRTLFDCDSTNIEYAYYSTLNVNKTFRIMRTDGTVLLEVDSANGPYCIGSCLGLTDVFVPIRNTSDGAKLFLQKLNPNEHIYIYSLCGELPVDIFDLAQYQPSFVNVFPNPGMGLLTFQINITDNMQEFDLVIVDGNAKEIKRMKIEPQTKKYILDTENLSSGFYYYSLCNKNKVFQSGKFILSR